MVKMGPPPNDVVKDLILQIIRSEKVILNGKTVQENKFVSGSTRSSMKKGWVAEDKAYIQGDHGPVAIRLFDMKSQDYSALDASFNHDMLTPSSTAASQ
ncbi:hypothetical protein Poly41_49440 [Novipirellula artificiosorum]|uniref:Uncharacterized protein n=2 Tax=Novipirellula artificiosorum TaxID=2528016 RepID=A0A5C6D8D6_9BACT|nr:hypothetical protein Poly41_49440 [Novipirellula artificiosorum]